MVKKIVLFHVEDRNYYNVQILKFENLMILLESSFPSLRVHKREIERQFSKLMHTPDHPPYASVLVPSSYFRLFGMFSWLYFSLFYVGLNRFVVHILCCVLHRWYKGQSESWISWVVQVRKQYQSLSRESMKICPFHMQAYWVITYRSLWRKETFIVPL